ncbi:MAG TPA: Flp family type IVb pilin [Dehalococcoidia bacterium]|jgi:pilus assembly protein Flp/PilA|nr:Flp family type IVb pilin [Dehalococcoidia bacterium]
MTHFHVAIAGMQRLFNDERGQTLIEYSLVLSLIAMAAVATIGIVGDEVFDMFTWIQEQVEGATSTP